MLPANVVNNLPNRRDVYFKSSADARKAFNGSISSDLLDQYFGHFRAPVLFSSIWPLASLVGGIVVVVLMAPWEKVIRIAAWRIVAFMADQLSLWQWTYHLFVNRTRCQFSSTQSTTSVFCFILSNPRPALVWATFVNTRPELMMAGSPSAGSAEFPLKGFLPAARWASKIGLEQCTYYSALAQLGETI